MDRWLDADAGWGLSLRQCRLITVYTHKRTGYAMTRTKYFLIHLQRTIFGTTHPVLTELPTSMLSRWGMDHHAENIVAITAVETPYGIHLVAVPNHAAELNLKPTWLAQAVQTIRWIPVDEGLETVEDVWGYISTKLSPV